MIIKFIGGERVDLHTVLVRHSAEYTLGNEIIAGAFTSTWSCLNHDNEVQGCYFTGTIHCDDKVLDAILKSIIAHGPIVSFSNHELTPIMQSNYCAITDVFSESTIKEVAIRLSDMKITAVELYDTYTARNKSYLTIEITINDLFIIRHTEAHGFTIPHSNDVACYDRDIQNTAHYIHSADLIAQHVNLPTNFEDAIRFFENIIN